MPMTYCFNCSNFLRWKNDDPNITASAVFCPLCLVVPYCSDSCRFVLVGPHVLLN